MNRIAKVQKLLGENSLDALVIDQVVDLYYLTQQELSMGRLVVEAERATLFVDGRYFEACKKSAPCEVILTTGYDRESPFGSWWKLKEKRVGFDALTTSYSSYENLKSLGAQLVPLNNPMGRVREIKEAGEIANLRLAAELGSRGMDFLCTQFKEGVSEREMARELEIFWLRAGGEKLAFAPHVSFGEGSSQPHYHVGERKLQRGDLILVDIGVVLNKYHSDMTRVFFFGKPQAELEKIYHIVKAAFESAVKLCRPGTKIGDLDRAARKLIEEAGYGTYFTHGLGHGVGLEIHESPRIRSIGPDAERPLQAGMVITIEPGIYLPALGGVRLEDTLLITENGHENLTARPFSDELPLF